nr:hypothetical protein [Allomuricauda sp.]
MSFRKKIKAGSLQFVLFIGAVIAVLLLTFVLLTHTHLLFAKKTDQFIEMVKQADFVLQRSFQQESGSLENVDGNFGNDGIKTKMLQGNWGVFGISKITSSFQKSQFTKVALVGGGWSDTAPALFLADNDRPMIIVGKSQIIGDAFIPRQGIRPGHIGGQSFHGTQPVLGNIGTSTKALPKIDTNLYTAMLNRFTKASNNSIFLPPNFGNNEIKNSFNEETLWLDADKVDLFGKKIIGNIIVHSAYNLVVEPSTTFQDAILIAPEVVIKDGVEGTFQVFASHRIEVGENCTLRYPSALVLVDKKPKTTNRNAFRSDPDINISRNSIVKGIVGYINAEEGQRFYPQIKIEENAMVVGQVYCEKNLELKGTVWGSVTTHAFMALENGNVYQNHLFNGSIDATGLPKEFLGMGYGQNHKKGVVKWLY